MSGQVCALAALPLGEITMTTQGMRGSMDLKDGLGTLDKIKISCLKVGNERAIVTALPHLAELFVLSETL